MLNGIDVKNKEIGMSERKKDTLKASIVLLVYALWIIFKRIAERGPGLSDTGRVLLNIPFYIAFGIIVIFIFRKDFLDGIKDWKDHWLKNVLVLAGILILNPVLGTIALIPGYTIWPDGGTINDSNIENFIRVAQPALIILATGILGPVVEETIFRIILIKKASLDNNKSKLITVISIVISSFLFLLIHCHEFTAMEILLNMDKFVAGLLFGSALWFTKNPTVPALAHILNNTVGLTLIMLFTK